MSSTLRRKAAVEAELRAAQQVLAQELPGDAFRHLERAHVLGQARTWLHVRTHWAMLRWAWQERDGREGAGQLTRLFAAALFTRLWVPLGNTGGANVSATRPMPIPPDLAAQLADFDAK
ncbi:DUF3703 domain-containing protein [Tahibacter aquaticus]|uniref:DUF3703 domain-containing protein n=1 Tax=Tahibacter aquaticus TaxID=520092 RepID=UPI001FB74404|nr:DUF3703 domain-containing protein [Tahibacter aquaticus]